MLFFRYLTECTLNQVRDSSIYKIVIQVYHIVVYK